jgi:hypothetical protein
VPAVLFAAVSAKSSDTAPEIIGVGANTAVSSAVAKVADESARVAIATVIKVFFILFLFYVKCSSLFVYI